MPHIAFSPSLPHHSNTPPQTVFHELSEEIRKLPLMENEFQPQQSITMNHQLLESFDYDPTHSFRGGGPGGGTGSMNPNDFLLHTGSSSGMSGTGSFNRLGGTGSSTESHNGGGYGMNTLQSVPESPIRRSASPTRLRESASPTSAPFIPRSSTHRYLPSTSPHRRSNESSLINTDQLGDIIKDAISSAVEAAQVQWIKELKSGTFSHPDYAGSENFHHRFVQLSSKVDILQDQVSHQSSSLCLSLCVSFCVSLSLSPPPSPSSLSLSLNFPRQRSKDLTPRPSISQRKINSKI
jgi:hypothetical protein